MKASDYRLIKVCVMLYTKLLQKFKKIIPLIISLSQSAFIPKRLITDYVIITYKTSHTMKSRMKGKEGSMVLKLDISKAYDRIEWMFLEAMMRKMSFGDKWIILIMRCISSVSYSVLINGQPCMF